MKYEELMLHNRKVSGLEIGFQEKERWLITVKK